VLDKIRKDLGELIEKQDRILQRFKKKLSQKKQSSFTRELDSRIDKLQYNVDESRSTVSMQLGREIRKKIKKDHNRQVNSLLSTFIIQANKSVHGEVITEQEISNAMLVARMIEMMDYQKRMLDKILNKSQEMEVEGVCMPQYYGRMLESVDLLFYQSVRFL